MIVQRGGKTIIKPYHHGDLKAAILDAGEALLREKGVDKFSLRSVAKMAGVTPAAPAHHFGNITGIFSSLAARGYDKLDECLLGIDDSLWNTSAELMLLICEGYLDFAEQNPSLFKLMFDCEKLNWEQEDLQVAASRSLRLITDAVRGRTKLGSISADTLTELHEPEMLANWAIMHGFAHLLIEKQLVYFTGPGKERQLATACLKRLFELLATTG